MNKWDYLIDALDNFREARKNLKRFEEDDTYDPVGNIEKRLRESKKENEKELDVAFHEIIRQELESWR